MKKMIHTLLAFTLLTFNAYAQLGDAQKYIEEGIKLHDAGDYKGAIKKYQKALDIDKNSPLANYEIASTYFAAKSYQNAIDHCDKVISAKSNYVDQAYIVKGSALDLLGKPKDAIKSYKKGIKEFPDNHLLHYNLALTYFNSKQYKEAEEPLQKAITIKPTHASSHLLLGYAMSNEGKRVQSLLALYHFLLLEPKGERAKMAYKLLDYQNKKGISREGANNVTINISMDNKNDEFSAAEMMISLLGVSGDLESNKGKTEYELRTENIKSFFSVLGELKKENKGFWWNFYVDYFYEMKEKEHVEAFSYYITQSKDDETITTWLSTNKEKVDALAKWSSEYERKPW